MSFILENSLSKAFHNIWAPNFAKISVNNSTINNYVFVKVEGEGKRGKGGQGQKTGLGGHFDSPEITTNIQYVMVTSMFYF